MTEEELKDARHRVKRRLYRYLDLKRERDQIAEELETLQGDATSPQSPNLDGMPRASGYGDAMVGKVSEIINLRERYERKRDEISAAMLAIEDAIEGLEPVERTLLRYRYIYGMTWEKVCVAMNYSWRQTHNIHAKALDKLVEQNQQ